MSLIFNTPTEAFESLYDIIVSKGITVNGTKAIYGANFIVERPLDNIITTPFRKFSEKYAEREWQWYLSGNRSVKEIKKYAPIWDKMHGGDNIVNSNYGYQWNRNAQLHECIEQLKKDRFTRRAWMTIFDGKEKSDYAFDTPCTLSIGFYVNPSFDVNALNIHVSMRSNDLIYGFCNDQYCFSKLLTYVANKTGLKVGYYNHFANDLHIYENFLTMKEKYEIESQIK